MKLTVTYPQNLEKQAALLERSVKERIALDVGEEIKISLSIDATLGAPESYRISTTPDAWEIVGSDSLGVYYGIGKFLHSATWHATSLEPLATNGVVTPACPFRATYYSVHFHNWYHEAPIEEFRRSTEEVLLYGYNTIFCILPIVNMNNFEDETFQMFREKTRTVFQIAKELGMKVGTILNGNQGLKTSPDHFAADPSCYEGRTGGGGRNICPEIPGAMDYLRNIWHNNLAQYADIGLDYVMSWPYDEGGCGCEKCRPWGAKGFVKLSRAMFDEAKSFFPNAQMIVSAWYFDEKFDGPWDELGEFEGMYDAIRNGTLGVADYLMVDSHNSFPHYPLEHEPVRPIINFPEISMYGLRSWGGRGANPLPRRFQEIWDSSKRVLSGGMPYSEGMYEDISKVQFAGYYWHPDKHYREILGEYIRYEYSDKVVPEVLELMELIEKNHVLVRTGNEPDFSAALRAEELAEKINTMLGERAKSAWRWRILYIRAHIDRMVYEYYMNNCRGMEKGIYEIWQTREAWLADNDEAQELLQELCRWYHSIDKEMGKNQWTFPPVKNGKVLK